MIGLHCFKIAGEKIVLSQNDGVVVRVVDVSPVLAGLKLFPCHKPAYNFLRKSQALMPQHRVQTATALATIVSLKVSVIAIRPIAYVPPLCSAARW